MTQATSEQTGATPTRPTAPAPPAAPETTYAPRPPWRDRLWTWRSMLGVAVASLIIGGLGGAGIVAAAHHDSQTGPGGRFGFSRGGFPGGLPGRGTFRGPGGAQPGGGTGFPGGGGASGAQQ